MHALWGNTFALFLSDILVDAIAEISASSNPAELLGQLRKEEDVDYEKFFKPVLPVPEELRLVPVDDDLLDSANVSVFFRSPSICRTGLLPSQSRYLGITTESRLTGVQDYYKGLSMNAARKMVSNGTSTPMPLVYDESEREDCEFEVIRDFKDFFFVSSKMGWTTLTIPNEAEKREYGRNSEALHGVILLCYYNCPWGQCPKGTIVIDSIVNGTVQIEVNNQPVTNVSDFGQCSVLRGEKGHRFNANKAGQFDVRMQIPDTGPDLSFMRISSIVVL